MADQAHRRPGAPARETGTAATRPSALAREGVALAADSEYVGLHADVLLDLAEVLRLAGRSEEAEAAAVEAVRLYERKGNVAGMARAATWSARSDSFRTVAIVDATRELEPRERPPIGWDGRRLDEMLATSERLFAETGSYLGLAGELELKDSDPIGYEKLFSRLRGGLVSARETALNISASPIVRELGELCFALYTPEGDSIALSTGIIVHVHTMSDAIKCMVRKGYEDNPGIRPGDIFANNDPDRRRPQRRRADLRPDLRLRGPAPRAGRLGGWRHPRARHRRLDARRGARGADQPARRRHRPPVHEDRRARRDRPWHLGRCPRRRGRRCTTCSTSAPGWPAATWSARPSSA